MSDTAFFYLSKGFWLALNPGILLLAGLLVGVGLLWTRRWRAGRRVLLAVVGAAAVVAVVPVGPALLIPLENRFPRAALPDRVDGILILGGTADPLISLARGRPELTEGVDRLIAGAELAKRFPDAKVVFTGGTGDPFRQHAREADVLGPVFDRLGMDGKRLAVERRSRNTYENALYSKELLAPQTEGAWVLVTSAFHMPRAMGVFRHLGWNVIAHPVDYRFAGDEVGRLRFDLIDGLREMDAGLHEWVGLLAYRLTGKTDALFPAP